MNPSALDLKKEKEVNFDTSGQNSPHLPSSMCDISYSDASKKSIYSNLCNDSPISQFPVNLQYTSESS